MKTMTMIFSAAVVLGLAGAAKADLLVQYSTADSNPAAYTYVGGDLAVVSEPVSITIFAPNSYGSPTPTNTTGTLSVTLSGVSGSAGVIFGFEYTESIAVLDFSLTADTPIGGLTNILSGSADTGAMYGTSGGLSINAENPTNNVAFTSDFIDVSNLGDFSLQMNTGATSTLSVTDANLDDFTAEGSTGSFSAEAVPEPTSMGLLAAGAAMLLARRRRRI